MSIISRIRRGRQQAKDHTTKTTEDNNAAMVTPYHHVPNHAASDAFSTAPMDARISGQIHVREPIRVRRGAAGSQEQQMNVPGIPRMGSSLSTTTYSTSDSSCGPRGSSVAGSSMTSSSYGVSYKGKEADRSPYHSRAPSKGGVLSSESLGESLNQQKSKRSRMAPTIKPINIPQPNTEGGRPHRLHPSARSVSDVSINRLAQVAKLASTPIAERPRIPSTGLPLPQTPTRPIVCISTSPYSSPPYSQSLNPGGYSSFWDRHSRQGSVSSLPALTPTSAKHSSGPLTPQRCATRRSMEPAPHSPLLDFNFQFDGASLHFSSLEMDEKNEQRRVSRSRYQEKEIIDPSVGLLDFGLPRNNRHTAPSLRPGQIINTFPEPVTPTTPTSRGRSWTFTKAGSKLLRKNHRRGDSKMTI